MPINKNYDPAIDPFVFSWEIMDVFIRGQSPIDVYSFMGQLNDEEDIASFLNGYGYDMDNPVQLAELFGIYQEAIQFIRRYLLQEGNPEGIALEIPMDLVRISDVRQLLLLAVKGRENPAHTEIALWAGIVLKVMHTFLHMDKDLRHRYFTAIQMQILDRFYKHLHRDDNNQLYLGEPGKDLDFVPLVEFQTKAKKSRESTIIKLLHKRENVAEELFDRVGVRLITKTKFDCLRVIKYLTDNYVIVAHNIKPSRCVNTLIDIEKFQPAQELLEKKLREKSFTVEEYLAASNKLADKSLVKNAVREKNEHTLVDYRAIHFTCRHLIKYTNPFMNEFTKVRNWAKDNKEQEISQMLLKLDTSTISRNLMFFYPFEVQIADQESYVKNTEGEASHAIYKKQQVQSAIVRLFRPIMKLKGLEGKGG
ncbi:MAG: TIGR04552 family protein [Bacteriovoracaceae bacterium]|nr:TIGR04552 family protein [Bacteriovoracaceae bacterium]